MIMRTFLTTQELILSKKTTPSTDDVVRTLGYSSTGDSGGGEWKHNGVTGQTPSQSPAQLGDALLNDASGNQWEYVPIAGYSQPVVPIKDLGATVDGATSDYSVMVAARDFLVRKYAAGGVIDLGAGVIAIDSTFVVSTDGIFLKGNGRGDYTNGKATSRATAATRLLWTGTAGGTMVRYTSDPANGGTEVRKNGGGILDVCLDGNESAGECLEVLSWNGGQWRFTTCYATNYHWLFDTLTNGTTGSAADTQSNDIDIISHDVNTSSEPTTLGIFHGDTTANTSLNHIKSLILTAESTAIGLELGGCDGNQFDFIRVGTRAAAVGDGGKLIMHADDTMTTVTSRNDHCRHNNIAFIQAVRGVKCLDTIAGTKPARDNSITVYSGGNGSPFPSVEAGCTLTVRSYDGVDRLSSDDGTASYSCHRSEATTNQTIGSYKWESEDNAGNINTYARIAARVVDNTDGSEDGQIDIYTDVAGAEVRPAFIWRGLTVGTSGAGDQGDGTINCSTSYHVQNTKVVDTRKTGWTAPTGTATRTGFATSTATTQQVAEALKALIDDLISHGLIGS